MVSSNTKILIALVVVFGILSTFGVYYYRIQDDNVKYSANTQAQINAIIKDPNLSSSNKNAQIDKMVANFVDELRKRDFKCARAFIVNYDQINPQNP